MQERWDCRLKGNSIERACNSASYTPFFVFKRMPDGAFAVHYNQKTKMQFCSIL